MIRVWIQYEVLIEIIHYITNGILLRCGMSIHLNILIEGGRILKVS